MDLHKQGYRGEISGILTEHLEGLEFPVNKEMILRHATQSGLDEELLSELEGLPSRQFTDLREVLDHFEGGTMSTQRSSVQSDQPAHTGDEDLTGLRHGRPTTAGSGSRNVRDIEPE
jgi:hypothetical protein